ncbi:MAG: hypothetical protein GXO23_02070 [Crenarchaeota archaeon]|nr:hypothetical protein [Thermoproteota archaeon]
MLKTRKLNIIYVEPFDIFYPSVLLRTAYSALGKSLTSFTLITRRRVRLGDIARYSRVPIPRLREILSIREEHVNVSTGVLVSTNKDITTSSIGRIMKFKEMEELTIVVDETGEMRQDGLEVFRTGFFDHPAYEAVALLYILYIRDLALVKKFKEHKSIPDIDYGELIYFMRNIASSISIMNNYPIIDPRSVVYTLRHVFRNHNMLLDLAKAEIGIDYSDNRVIEKVIVDIYRYRDLRYIRTETILFDGERLDTIFVTRSGALTRVSLYVDSDRREVCVDANVCVSSRREDMSEELLSFLF